MPGIKSLSAALALGAGFAVGAAHAADMRAPPLLSDPVAQERLEFGTGWYLRGDISWSRERLPAVFPDPALAVSNKVQNGWTASIGGGYKFNNWFRTDLTYDYVKGISVNAKSGDFTCYSSINPVLDQNDVLRWLHAQPNACHSQQSGRLNRYVMLANGYLDLGTWAGVTPYIGAGAGVAYGRATGNYDWYTSSNGVHYSANLVYPNPSPLPEIWLDLNGNEIARPVTQFGVQDHRASLNRKTFNLAYALMAGFAYDVSPNAKIDMGYRYLNLGKFGNGTKSAIVNEYRIGVRYMID